MTVKDWAEKLSPRWAEALTETFQGVGHDLPLSKWDVFDVVASYEGGLTAHEARDLIKEVYGIDLRR